MKSLKSLIQNLSERNDGKLNGGFHGIRGGTALDNVYVANPDPCTNNSGCSNSQICSGSNVTESCSNSGICSDASNTYHCTNSAVCFA